MGHYCIFFTYWGTFNVCRKDKTWEDLVTWLNKVVIPTSLLGGFIGLLLSLILAPILIGEDTFIDVDLMGYIVYHALAIGFISLALKRNTSKIKEKDLVNWVC